LVLVFVAARSLGIGPPGAAVWALTAAAVALRWPVGGALALAALGPFDDWRLPATDAGARAVLVAALVASTAFRAGPLVGAAIRRNGLHAVLRDLSGYDRWAAAAAILGSVVLIGTGLGVVHSALRFGPAFGVGSAALWATGPAIAFGVFLAGIWLGRAGERRIVFVAVAAVLMAIGVALIQRVAPQVLPPSPLGWLIVAPATGPQARLSGVTTSSIAMATMSLLPLAVAGAYLVHGIGRSRIVAALSMPALVGVVVMTLSRSALAVVALGAFLFAGRAGRRVAIATLVLGVLGALVLIPLYLDTRVEPTRLTSLEVLFAEFFTLGDAHRAAAWQAALKMGLDSPLIGQGFRSFMVLHAAYGEPLLQAPHDEWLRLFAEEGIVVAAAGIGFVLAALTCLWRDRTAVSLGAFGALLGWAFMATFNNPLNYAQVNIPIFLVAGTAIGLAIAPSRRPQVPSSSEV